MAIAGGAAPSWIAKIVDGKLVLTNQSLRQNVERDPKEAVRRMQAGEEIFLHAYMPIVSETRKLIEGEDED